MGTHTRGSCRESRTRWAALGAAVAVTLGAGGIGMVSATSPSEAVTFVPITPCRVIDTRPAFNVGSKSSPLGAGEIYTVSAHGANGDCTGIPATAAAISMNVTAVGATAPTFLTIWANGEPQPVASSLNPFPGSPPAPNAVTTDLSATGQFDIYNLQGDVDVLADINGYYVDHDHDDRYYTEGEIDGLLAGLGGGDPLFRRLIVVPGDGTPAENGARLVDAINTVAAANPTDDSPWAIFLEPGRFEATSFPDLPSHTSVRGSGQEATTVFDPDDGPTFQSAGAVRLDGLTIAQGGTDPTVSFTGAVAMRDMRVVVGSPSLVDGGISLDGAFATLDNLLVDDGGGTNNTVGLTAINGADVRIDSSEFTGVTRAMISRDSSTSLAIRNSMLDSDNGFVASLSAGGGEITIDNSVITDQITLGTGLNSVPVDLTIRNSSMERIFFNSVSATATRTVRIENTSMSGGIDGGAGDGLTEAIVRSVTMDGTVSADSESCVGVSTPGGFFTNSCP